MDSRAKNYVNNHVFLPKGEGGKRQKPFIRRKKMGGISANRRMGRGTRRNKFLAGRRIMSTIITFSSRNGKGETAKTFY
jgi:hypothetical protein